MKEFKKSDIESVHDGMEEGGHISEAVFGNRLITDIDDNLSEITIDELEQVGVSRAEAEIFICAVAASARSNWKTTQNILFLEMK